MEMDGIAKLYTTTFPAYLLLTTSTLY